MSGAEDRCRNVLTFDIEDWHQLVEWKLNGTMPSCSSSVLEQTYALMELLAAHGVRATSWPRADFGTIRACSRSADAATAFPARRSARTRSRRPLADWSSCR